LRVEDAIERVEDAIEGRQGNADEHLDPSRPTATYGLITKRNVIRIGVRLPATH
jgi:hypothetical protein